MLLCLTVSQMTIEMKLYKNLLLIPSKITASSHLHRFDNNTYLKGIKLVYKVPAT